MIHFNITLLIQAVNFMITVYVLRRFLFDPVVERIISRRKEEKQLRDEIILKKQDVENFRTEKIAQLSQFQKDAKTDFPFTPATNPASPHEVPAVKVATPTAADLQDMQDALEKRVRHGG